MIGHYLFTLSPEQEDGPLTEVMRPGCAPKGCLLGLTESRDVLNYLGSCGHTYSRRTGRLLSFRQAGYVGDRYDHLCPRFGTPRINAAIRNRILSNRARRILGASVSVGVQTA